MFLAIAYVCNAATNSCYPISSPYTYESKEQCEAANLDARKLMKEQSLEVIQMWCLSLGEEA